MDDSKTTVVGMNNQFLSCTLSSGGSLALHRRVQCASWRNKENWKSSGRRRLELRAGYCTNCGAFAFAASFGQAEERRRQEEERLREAEEEERLRKQVEEEEEQLQEASNSIDPWSSLETRR